MKATSRQLRRRSAVGLAAVLGVAMLALVAYFETARRATGREIASLTSPRDRLQSIVERLETQSRQAESDRRVVLNVLGLCRSAEDIPNLRGNRVVAQHQGLEKLCLYVPEGSHTLEVSSTCKPRAKPNQSGEANGADAVEPTTKTWNLPLLPACGYLLKLVNDRKAEPIHWELTSNHPDFPTQTETVPADGFSQRGSSWSGTDVVQFPNQIERFSMNELEAAATARAGINLMSAMLFGVRGDEPYEIAFNVRLHSETRPCVSASDAQRILVLRGEHSLQPYAGEGKYDIRNAE